MDQNTACRLGEPEPDAGRNFVLVHDLDVRRRQPFGEVDQLCNEACRDRIAVLLCVGRHQRVLCAACERSGLDGCAAPCRRACKGIAVAECRQNAEQGFGAGARHRADRAAAEVERCARPLKQPSR